MSQWHVSESDSEDGNKEEMVPNCRQELLGFKLDPVKLPELLLAVQRGGSLDLQCASNYKRRRKVHRRNAKRKKPKVLSPAGGELGNAEEVSETMSEVRSTRTASSDCRDMRLPSLSAFDYEHEEFPALTTLMAGAARRKLPTRQRIDGHACVASMKSVDAGLKKEREERRKERVWTSNNRHSSECKLEEDRIVHPAPETTTTRTQAVHNSSSNSAAGKDDGQQQNQPDEGDDTVKKKKCLRLSFDEDDSELNSSDGGSDIDGGLLSQLVRVEHFLENEELS